MRVIVTGKFQSVCEYNVGRLYDDRGNLVATSRLTGRGRRLYKRAHARKLRRMPIGS